MRARRTGIALLLAAGLAGCGSSGDNQPGLTNGQVQALVTQLRAVRSTAATHDLAATKTALTRFRNSVTRLRRSGALSDATARTLRIGAARVLARVESDNPTPAASTPTTTQTTPAPAPAPPPAAKKKHGEKHDEGKGKHGKEGE